MNKEDLMKAFAKLPPCETGSHKHSWPGKVEQLRKDIRSNNLSDLLSWPTLTSSFVVGNAPYIPNEYDNLVSVGKDFVDSTHDSGFGKPEMYNSKSSCNYVHQVYHFSRFYAISGCVTAKELLNKYDGIIEFGGGYGAMAVVLRQLGFTGDYHIYDLPELSLIQQYYLNNVGCDAHFHTSIDTLPKKAGLLIACYSISECNVEDRNKFVDGIEFDDYLFAYLCSWFGYGNENYFVSVQSRFERRWHSENALSAGSYLFGVK